MVKVLRFSLFYFAFALSLSGFAHSIRPACNVTKSPLSHLGITNADAAVYAKMSERPHYHFFVWLKDGRYDAYAFDAKPKVYYEDGYLFVDSDEGSYRYANEDVHKITFSDNETPVPTGISAVPDERYRHRPSRAAFWRASALSARRVPPPGCPSCTAATISAPTASCPMSGAGSAAATPR